MGCWVVDCGFVGWTREKIIEIFAKQKIKLVATRVSSTDMSWIVVGLLAEMFQFMFARIAGVVVRCESCLFFVSLCVFWCTGAPGTTKPKRKNANNATINCKYILIKQTESAVLLIIMIVFSVAITSVIYTNVFKS